MTRDAALKAVIFDMDGVLIDSEGTYLNYEWEFAREKNPEVRLEQLFPMAGATRKEAWEVLAAAVGNGQSWEELREEFRRRDIYSRIDYRKLFRPEAAEVLPELKSLGFCLAVASSTHLELVQRILKENEILHYFDAVVSGGQFKRSKPDPEIYHHTAALLGASEKQCLAVEDSTVGITAAYRAGMKVAAVVDKRYCFDQSLADYHIGHLSEVLKILKTA